MPQSHVAKSDLLSGAAVRRWPKTSIAERRQLSGAGRIAESCSNRTERCCLSPSAIRPSGCFARGRHDTAADGRRQANNFQRIFPNALNFLAPSSPRRKIFFFRFSEKCDLLRPASTRGAFRDRHERGRWDAVAAAGRETSASVADGEAGWFWRPFAGVKFATRQRVARMTGSKQQLVPGESAE